MTLSQFLRTLSRSLAACALTATAVAQETLVTSASRFQIPFEVEAVPGEPVPEFAVLFGSQDGGASWEKLQTVPAAQQNFQFSAPRDGVYAFAVRMMDAAGNLQTIRSGSPPELQIVVDSREPELKLELYEVAPGQVMLNWQAGDASLDLQSLVLEYTDGQDGRWKAIQTSPAATGQASMQVPAGSVVSVRGSIADTAGNRGNGSTQMVLRAPAPAPPQQQRPTTFPGGSAQPTGGMPSGPTPFHGQQPAPGFSGLHGPLMQTSGPSLGGPQLSGAPSIVTQQPLPTTPAAPATPNTGSAPPLTTSGLPDLPPLQPGPEAAATLSTATALISSPAPPMNAVYGGDAAAGDLQLVNNRIFDIVYELQDVGPSGVGSVDLFVTEDGGQQWFRYGQDTDLRSPFQVDVQGEGTFGFAVRVRNGLGFADAPPQPGEPPAIVVSVDQTPPVVEFPQPTLVANGNGIVTLKWSVSDSHPAATPVRLEYATSAAGPWTPLFDWQADAGSYQWPVRPGTPPALHFRLLARDAAGNVSSAQTQPVLIDLQRPTVSGLRIQAVSQSRPAPRGY